MSALRRKADISDPLAECPLMTQSRHSRYVAVDGRFVLVIRLGFANLDRHADAGRPAARHLIRKWYAALHADPPT